MSNHFYNLQASADRKGPQILYAGNSISSTYLAELVEYVKDKEFSVNVISKSGTTTEPAIAFRVFKELLIENTVKKKLTNVSTLQLIKLKVLLKLKLLLTIGKHLLFQITLVDVSQY